MFCSKKKKNIFSAFPVEFKTTTRRQGKRGERSKDTKGVLPMNEFSTGWHL